MLPAAASLRKQGASNGATTAFLISTPESGVDSIALTYALLDPVMAAARPAAAFATAAAAGLAENLLSHDVENNHVTADLSCTVDGCCDGIDCPPENHSTHHSFSEKLWAGLRYAFRDLWGDLAFWFLIGIFLAGLITTLIPAEFMTAYLGGGVAAMVIMLAVGIPLYICATASTPIAAALILQGVSPGAALVFLLTGPATNVASLVVLLNVLGRKAVAIYLFAIVSFSVACGLLLDQVYALLGISAQAVAGHAAHIIPPWAQLGSALTVLALSIKPILKALRSRLTKRGETAPEAMGYAVNESSLEMTAEVKKDCCCTSSASMDKDGRAK